MLAPVAPCREWGSPSVLPSVSQKVKKKFFFFFFFFPEPQIRRDHPLNLSILISGGRETNKDSPSNGERSGNSSSLKSLALHARELWAGRGSRAQTGAVEVDLERHVREGESPVCDTAGLGRYCLRRVGVVWECSPKWVVNSI